MTELTFIKSNEKRDIIKELNKELGIEELPYLFIQIGKEKYRAYSGHLSKDEIIELGKSAKIENIGVYFMKKENNSLRLSFDALHLIKSQITKNIIEINDEQAIEWMKGNDLNIKSSQGLKAIKHNGDFLGCGKSNTEKIFNHVPKERRLR